jgi:uncharacterized membrane protein YqiK
LFGYASADVDRSIGEYEVERRVMQAELERLRSTPDVSPEVSGHLAALLQSFAETVAEGQREAEARAAQVVADAEERAAHLEANALKLLDQANEMVANTYAEAATRYQEATAARQHATERIGEAVERLADALAILGEVPEQLPAAPSMSVTDAMAFSEVPDHDGEPLDDGVPGGPVDGVGPAASNEAVPGPTVLSVVRPSPAA